MSSSDSRQSTQEIERDLTAHEGERTTGELGADYRHLDITSEGEWESVVSDTVSRHGRLDILMNNAGIFESGQLVNTSTEMWNRVVTVNQTGVFLGMRTVAKAMIEAGNGGSIINTSSIAGLHGMFGSAAYGATKWAVTGMTKTAAKELGKQALPG